MGVPATLVWTERMPYFECDKALIDSLWCCKDRATNKRKVDSYALILPLRFMDNPVQGTMNAQLDIEKGTVLLVVKDKNGKVVISDSATNAGASAKKTISVSLDDLHGKGGSVDLFLKANTNGVQAIVKNKVVYTLSETAGPCLVWKERLPATLTWTERVTA